MQAAARTNSNDVDDAVIVSDDWSAGSVEQPAASRLANSRLASQLAPPELMSQRACGGVDV